jgi:lipopolysaccharide export system protein LptA
MRTAEKRIRILALLFAMLPAGLLFSQNKALETEPIRFKADKMEYVFRKGAEQVTCRGRARMERSDFFLNAKLIHIYGEKKDYAKAYEDIKMVNKIDQVVIFGNYAEYDNPAGYAKVFKSPRLVYTNQDLEITSAVMETFLNENRSVAIGNVKITQTNYTAYGEKAVFNHNTDTIELTGNPVAYMNKNMFRAKKIVVYTEKKLVKLYDSVQSRIVPDRED